MCGICGVVDFGRTEVVDGPVLAAMNGSLRHRGPDEHGSYTGRHAALAMHRLQVIDPASGRQPMSNEDGTIRLVFNGEIYNFQGLRETLRSCGHVFRTKSDTEVVVHAYEEFGDGCLDRLRGMFGFALWDAKRERLLLARDRLGIKPVHYWMRDGRLAFASEIKALLHLPDVAPRVDEQALDLYLAFGYVPAPRTIFRDVAKLPPAHYLVAERGGVAVRRYWDFTPADRAAKSTRAYCDELISRLRESVRAHLVSDVPLGAFLSGGLDSSTVVALMSEIGGLPVKTFSIGFREGAFNELPYARAVAERYRTEHHELVVEAGAIAQLPTLLDHFDEPFGDSSAIPTYLVSKFARERVTVVLTGDGGDEVFGGYEWQRRYQLTRSMRFVPAGILRRLPGAAGMVSAPGRLRAHQAKLRNFLLDAATPAEDGYIRRLTLFDAASRAALYTPELRARVDGWNSGEALLEWLRRPQTADFRNRMLYADTHFYCPEDCLTKVDRMSMAWSLEARVPLLDHTFVEFMAGVPPDLKLRRLTSKYLLRRAVRPLLPPALLGKRKQGFSVPLGPWLRGPLRDALRDALCDGRARSRGWLEPATVEALVSQHLRGERDHSHRLWALLALEFWARRYLDVPRVPAAVS